MSDLIPPELRAALAAEATKEATDSDTRSQVEIKEAMTQLLEQYTNPETGLITLDIDFFDQAIPLQKELIDTLTEKENAQDKLDLLYRRKAAVIAREISESHPPIEGVSYIEGRAERFLEWADFIEPFCDAVEATIASLDKQGIREGTQAYDEALKPHYVAHLQDMADKVRELTGVEDPFFMDLSDVEVFTGYNTDRGGSDGNTTQAIFNNGQTPFIMIPSFTATCNSETMGYISDELREQGLRYLQEMIALFLPEKPYDETVTDPEIFQYPIGQQYIKSGAIELYTFDPEKTTDYLRNLSQKSVAINETSGFNLRTNCSYHYTDKEGNQLGDAPPNWLAGFPPCLRPMILLAQYQDADLHSAIQEVRTYITDNPKATTLPEDMLHRHDRAYEVFTRYSGTSFYSSQRLQYRFGGEKDTPLRMPGHTGSIEFYRQCMEAYQAEHDLPRQRPIEAIIDYTPPTETN